MKLSTLTLAVAMTVGLAACGEDEVQTTPATPSGSAGGSATTPPPSGGGSSAPAPTGSTATPGTAQDAEKKKE